MYTSLSRVDIPLVPQAVPLRTDTLARTVLEEGASGPAPNPRSPPPPAHKKGNGKRHYHLVFKSPFKSKPSLTGAPAVNHDHSIAQGCQGVEPLST